MALKLKRKVFKNLRIMLKKKDYNYLFKLMLIGNSSVGKTCILSRYSSDSFNPSYTFTVAIDFKIKTIRLNDKTIKLQVWDTAGQERFRSITTSYYRGIMGFLLVYDITDEKSFDCLGEWLHNINEKANEDAVCMIIGNKCDLEDQRLISTKQGQELAEYHKVSFMETSCKTNINVNRVFNEITYMILEKQLEKTCPPELTLPVFPSNGSTEDNNGHCY